MNNPTSPTGYSASQQLSFISADPRVFVDKLGALQGPTGSLAERVRVLTVWPNAIRDALGAGAGIGVVEGPSSRSPERMRPSTSASASTTASSGWFDSDDSKKLFKPKSKHTRTPSNLLQRGRERIEDLLSAASGSGSSPSSSPSWVATFAASTPFSSSSNSSSNSNGSPPRPSISSQTSTSSQTSNPTTTSTSWASSCAYLQKPPTSKIPWVLPPSKPRGPTDPLPSPAERKRMFLNTLKGLTRVDEYEVYWYVDHGAAGAGAGRSHHRRGRSASPHVGGGGGGGGLNPMVKSRSSADGYGPGLPGGGGGGWEDGEAWTFPFFAEIWHAVGPNLRKLTIDVQIFKMEDVLRGTGALLPRLEELDLTLRNEVNAVGTTNSNLGPGGRGRGDVHPSTSSLSTALPYFLNKLSPTLQTLSLKTIAHTTLSATLFPLLGEFPHLRKLSLIMPLDAHHLPDPSGLKRFLHGHPRVRELCIRYSRCTCRREGQKDYAGAEGGGGEDGFTTPQGGHVLFGGLILPILNTLELGLHLPIPNVRLSLLSSGNPQGLAMITAISQMTQSLNTLVLKDRSLTLEETRTVLRSFRGSQRLKKLSLYVRSLTPQLVDVVARECPMLSIWEVDVGEVATTEKDSDLGLGDNVERIVDDVAAFSRALTAYAIDLDADHWRYRTWTLSDVSVMKWEFQVGHQLSWPCMQAIADVVPTVRSFAGRGDMLPEADWDSAARTRRRGVINPEIKKESKGDVSGEVGSRWEI